MTDRPTTRAQMLRSMFPELGKGSTVDKEESTRLNTLACEAILADLIDLYDKGLEVSGPGTLTLRLAKGQRESGYYSLEDAKQDQHEAKKFDAPAVVSYLDEVIATVETTNRKSHALIMMCDNSSIRLFALKRDYPASQIQELLEEIN